MTKVAVCVQTGRKDGQGELDTHFKIFWLKIKSIDCSFVCIFRTKNNRTIKISENIQVSISNVYQEKSPEEQMEAIRLERETAETKEDEETHQEQQEPVPSTSD